MPLYADLLKVADGDEVHAVHEQDRAECPGAKAIRAPCFGQSHVARDAYERKQDDCSKCGEPENAAIDAFADVLVGDVVQAGPSVPRAMGSCLPSLVEVDEELVDEVVAVPPGRAADDVDAGQKVPNRLLHQDEVKHAQPPQDQPVQSA
ncbi:MAG: hypothetical protein ACI89X_002534 [Planctomycetota bacterium]